MDKRKVEAYMPLADSAIKKVFGDTKVDKTYRSKMSAFGATVIMSGLLPALAHYTKNENKVVELLEKMYNENKDESVTLFDIAKGMSLEDLNDLKELIINYSISLKLVLNLYI